MKNGQSFLKGVVLLTAAGIIVKLIGFIYRVILTNLPGYGDEGNGIYGAGYQVYMILFVLSTTGFPAAISKMVAEKMAVRDWRGAHKIFKVSLWLLACIGFTSSAVFFMASRHIAQWIANPRTVYTMMAISPTIFFVSIMAVFRGYFQGMQDMRPQANSQIVEQIAKTGITILLAYLLLPYGVELAAAGATLGTTLGAATGAAYLCNLYKRRKDQLRKNIRDFYTPCKQEGTASIIRKLLKLAIPISLGAAVLTIGNLVDLATVMPQLERAGFSNQNANQLYGILTGKCYVLTHFPVTVNVALATSLVPTIAASMAVKDFRTVRDKIETSLKWSVLIGLPSSAGIAILAQPILELLFPGTSEGAYLLVLSAMTIVFIGMTQTLSGIMQGLGHAVIPAISFFIGAVVKLIINFTLVPVPHINIKGAVYGTIACYILSTIINFSVLVIKFKLNLNLYNLIIKPIVATFVMGIATYYGYGFLLDVTGSNAIATLGSIAAAVAEFGFTILILGGINERELAVLPLGRKLSAALVRMNIIRR